MCTSPAKLCPPCSSLGLQRDAFERPPFEPEGRYNSLVLSGSVGYLREQKDSCPLCHLILEALYKNEGQSLDDQGDDTGWELTWSQNNQEYDPDSSEAEDLYGSGLYPKLEVEGSHGDHCIQLMDASTTKGFLRGREIPETIDPDMIKGWMERCTKVHGEDCKQSFLGVGTHPAISIDLMVIDVNKKCLVNMPFGAKYVALSYVWGQANFLTTVMSNVSEHQKQGALSRIMPPRTVKDAIDLTEAIGVQYLWVDALCIVQDEDESKGLLISNMDAIYGHAALTIVAASGTNADVGLRGFKSCPAERKIPSRVMGPGWKLGVFTAFDATIMQSPHAKRGWTYQEGCMSPRCLVILDGKAFFSCRESIWREDVMAEVDSVKPFEGANVLGRTPSLWQLRRYSQTVEAYTMRQLTYRSDILNAFSGIAKAMTTSMASTRMFYAMPAMAFDWAILWTGHLSLRTLKRQPGFPSWAWVGWEGEISMAGDIYNSFDHRWLLTRTWINWYIVLEDVAIGLIWDPDRDQSTVSPLEASDIESAGHSSCDHEEDVGNDESDEEDEEEMCPTYGSPSLKNPYGREVKPELLSVLPARPDPNQLGPFQTHQAPPGTLIFSTIVASFTVEPTSSSISLGRFVFKILDSSDRVCGFLWDESESIASEKYPHNVREILLLSQASPGTANMFSLENVEFHEHYQLCKTKEEALKASANEQDVDGENVINVWHSWDFFNVMLVSKVNKTDRNVFDGHEICVYERAGIGLLHKRALASTISPAPRWSMVHLR